MNSLSKYLAKLQIEEQQVVQKTIEFIKAHSHLESRTITLHKFY